MRPLGSKAGLPEDPTLPTPKYLEEGEAEQEEEHVDDLIDNEAACEADHDEHAGAHIDPVLGREARDQLLQTLEQRPSPRVL